MFINMFNKIEENTSKLLNEFQENTNKETRKSIQDIKVEFNKGKHWRKTKLKYWK